MGFVTVKVEGDDQEQVSGVAAGVMVGLENAGFTNVKLALEYEAKSIDAVINRDRSLDAPSTLLATLKMRNPTLFDQPVMVHVPVVNPTGGLTVFQTEDNRILEEKDDDPSVLDMRGVPSHIREDIAHGLTSALAATQPEVPVAEERVTVIRNDYGGPAMRLRVVKEPKT
jgi:hypothetical protein